MIPGAPCDRPNHDVLVLQYGYCKFCRAIKKTITDRRHEAAEARRDEGIERAAHAHADEVVGDDGRQSIGPTIHAAIVAYLETHETLFVDDLWDWAETHHEGWRALHIAPGRYIGAQLQRVQKDGLMEKIRAVSPVGCFVARPSHRSNLAPKWTFQSLIFDPSITEATMLMETDELEEKDNANRN